MTPVTIINQMAGDGLSLILTDDGQINMTGEAAIVERWLPLLREYKQSIILALSGAIESDPADTDDRRWCSDCTNLTEYGYCRAGERGEIEGAGARYSPWQGLPRRCESFINLIDTLTDKR